MPRPANCYRPDIRYRLLSMVREGEPNTCWMTSRKYPSLKVHGQSFLAHRLSLWVFRGTWAAPYPQTAVLHKCDEPRCINPYHLKVGTQRDNVRDAMAKNRVPQLQKRPTYCVNGHAFTPENTRYLIERVCITCHNERRRIRRAYRHSISIL